MTEAKSAALQFTISTTNTTTSSKMRDEAYPIIIGTLSLLVANILGLVLPWTGLNVDVVMGSYSYQVEEDISIFSCVDTTSSCGDFCCTTYNDGQLFDFWMIIVPTIPTQTSSSSSTSIASILLPFQIASSIALLLIVCSITVSIYSLLQVCTLADNREPLKRLRAPFRLTILINVLLVIEYIAITFQYLDGGYYSYGLWISAYSLILSVMSYTAVLFVVPTNRGRYVPIPIPTPASSSNAPSTAPHQSMFQMHTTVSSQIQVRGEVHSFLDEV